ncbi:MAG TPA: PIG-L deacetylase family protein [Vicinamibacterales bacterium]|jgi:LmbE family N-acetylglucosaminyl deacetylase|nr:PIG-L deacetylase family protein [Vicinamibacterales bacterium]
MIEFAFDRVKRVLCLGAHSDDIEIGCGGTLLKLLRDHPDVQVLWVVFSGRGGRSREARSSANAYLAGAGRKKVIVKEFRDGFFPMQAQRIKEYFEELKSTVDPDLVFTHYRDDRHQDHRVLSDLTWNTFRNHFILEYEIPKYDGDLGIPNFFVPLDEDLCRTKVGYLCQYFQTQSNKHWFSEETFRSLMRLRGMECASPTAYAEAFFCRKLVAG